jgi:hypothetical protein
MLGHPCPRIIKIGDKYMHYPNSIEEISYTEDHIDDVLSEIKIQFNDYFNKYINSEGGNNISDDKIKKLAEHFGHKDTPKNKTKDNKVILQSLLKEGMEHYEKDRNNYLEILDLKALDEYKDDPSHFKNKILRDKCPIIRFTLMNKSAKELDKYRKEFSISDPNKLLSVVTNITKFALNYKKNIYDIKKYDTITKVEELKFNDLLSDDYIVYGVIGGGIKSHFLYKIFPDIFPNRSREAIWALWYFTNKKKFNCKEDSEFLMIDLKYLTTQQNYFYPYDLFSYYALNIFQLIKKEFLKYDLEIPNDYRYVPVDSFLSFIFQNHIDEINDLKKKFDESGYGYGYQ